MCTHSCEGCGSRIRCNPAAEPLLAVDGAGRVRHFNVAAERALGVLTAGVPFTEILRRTPTISWMIQAGTGERDDEAALLSPLPDADRDRELLAAATTGILARGITHDLNNLFTCILAVATTPARGDAEPTRHMAAIKQAVLRGAELLNLLRELAPQDDDDGCDLFEVGEWCGLLLERVAARAGVAVEVEVPDVAVAMPSHELQQVIINLGLNAIDAMSGASAGRLSLRGAVDGAQLELTIADTGAGIPPERLAVLFEAGRSTKPGHSGVGLAVVSRIVRRAGGTITVDSAVGVGTSFRIRLPLARRPS